MTSILEPLNTAVDAVKHFLQTVITPPLEQVGGLLADEVKLWRFNNQIRIVRKAEERLRSKGMKTKKVSLKVMAPLLDECSLEDDEDLQNKWAALLANTVAENSTIKTNIFTSILKEMTSEDAEIFESIFEHCTIATETDEGVVIAHRNNAITPKAFVNYPEIDLIFDNLKRLRLIREITTHGSSQVPVVVSDLGLKFMMACG
jgi:hypothetical protein